MKLQNFNSFFSHFPPNPPKSFFETGFDPQHDRVNRINYKNRGTHFFTDGDRFKAKCDLSIFIAKLIEKIFFHFNFTTKSIKKKFKKIHGPHFRSQVPLHPHRQTAGELQRPRPD
tara:strand:- start:1554 stop:1898 length:345 start_codon:yes stop_codon:yes gene_type:complete